jgi:hypothetical protein
VSNGTFVVVAKTKSESMGASRADCLAHARPAWFGDESHVSRCMLALAQCLSCRIAHTYPRMIPKFDSVGVPDEARGHSLCQSRKVQFRQLPSTAGKLPKPFRLTSVDAV